ncbi:hypothetical protein BJ322DRAFT_1083658 [Thelephora terrestris]|uniref:Uncharacterized protein n=1 Tax=Thelephora terrestris TaxID=56493 RepID=A0A9P6L341_9AGAM|nr:hypothetical protein BJ322DRAFT_1083658 [Thelephora terrestris]
MACIIDFAAPLGQKAGPGQWNDLDMRPSPLILGDDLLSMDCSNETWTVITNTAIISINQDLNGQPGIRLCKMLVPEGGDLQLWASELVNRQGKS